MLSILNLIRWKNLVMIIIAQVLIKYALFEPYAPITVLDTTHFILLVLTTLCIAAAGNIINDIYDVDTDLVNKPDQVVIGKQISESFAYILFFTLNIIGVLLGLYLSHSIGESSFFSIFVIISILLYVYASYLKGTVLIGNLLISFLVAMSIIIVGVFDILPAAVPQIRDTQIIFLQIAGVYALFAFLINLVREIIKDIQDVDGDYKAGMNTLPIAIGRERANKIAFALSMLPIGALIYVIVTFLYTNLIVVGYFLCFVIAPLLYCTIKMFSAEHKSHYTHLSMMYKIILGLGLVSLVLLPLLLK
ncbi:geranylgeranylglycerol-phosphate geranylgeranyltransferase [Psychroserpens algicola]|uniref:Geranylgeranylglycerol-phosphate geranylgeranyltransferase n=1 Tax=Psychroserpens algicola TaxID=1719034 RepID=A0ABT0HD25_9FLAO|nr:geranylgeranylglycerol-phosphate geranylgeranyltransferase [Psychroserpens algicola]MCK8482082.1 geranylgeranylglycerol-phosphate geranylgeranyltransferase [Psychroserpens algicola]